MTERTEYLPFGQIVATAVSQDSGNHYRFTGKELDNETNLQYYGARYYDNRIGKFDSIDPMMLQIASDQRIQEKTGLRLHQLLSDPQSLNSYAYSRNNPIILVDPDGHWWVERITGKQSYNDFQVELGQAAQNMYETSSVWKNAMDHPVATGVVVGFVSGGLAYGAAAGLTAVSAEYFGGLGTGCLAVCDKGKDISTAVTNASVNIANSVSNLASKPIVKGALDKLEKVGDIIGKSPQEIIEKAENSTMRMVDNLNGGNINIVFQKADDISKGFVRVTLNPTADRIISAGFMGANQVLNGISNGRFTLF